MIRAALQRHRYGSHRHQFGDLHLPAGDAPTPLPVAVVLHGGFWRARFGLDLMDAVCADLAARGWAAWNVEYRRLGRRSGGGVPATLDDVAAAIDHLADLGAPLDLERVVTVGHSAGGQLALWAASRASARVRLAGAVGQAAVSDLERAAELQLGGGAVEAFCGGQPAARREAYRAASPAARLPLGVPQLLVHGEADDAVPAELSIRYAQAARAGRDEVTLVLRSGDGHFEHLDPDSVAWGAVVAWLERFT
jgi:acetyl esterase/lipase